MEKSNIMKTVIITVLLLGLLILNNIVIVVDAEHYNKNIAIKNAKYDHLPVNYTYEWPMDRHDLNNTGYTESDAPDTNDVLWTFTTGGDEVRASPVVVNGKVFIGTSRFGGTYGENMYCLDATNGSLIWNFTAGGQIINAAAVADGRVYFGCYKSHDFYCLDENTGNLIWNISLPTPYTSGPASAPTVYNCKVFVCVYDGNLYALDANDGTILWNFTTGHVNVVTTPAVNDGKVFFGSVDKNLYCVNESDGSLIWNYTTDSFIGCAPTILRKRVYIGDTYDKVYCINISSGEEIWNYTVSYPGGITGTAVDIYNDRVFFGVGVAAYYDNAYCLNASTGEYIWSTMTFEGYASVGVPIVADGKVYIGTAAYGYVYCYNASTGDLIWYYYPPGGNWATGGLAIAYGKLYVGMYNYKVYCFGEPTDKPTASIDDVSTNFTVEGKNITFEGRGNDTDSEIIKYYWESDIDGFLSSKPSFITNMLSVGNHTITFKVLGSDGEWSDEKTVNVTVRGNDKPVIDEIGDLVATEDETFSFYVNAFDLDGDNISFFDDSDLFEINSSTGLISFIPTNDDVGVYNITIAVVDEWDAENNVSFMLIIKNANDRPGIDSYNPTMNNPLINETENITFNISASDIDVGDMLGYEWYVNGILKGTNALYDFVSDYDSSGVYNVTVVVIDDGIPSLNDSHTWFLTVLNRNRPPVIEVIENQTVYEGQMFTLGVNVVDLDNDTLIFYDNTTLFDVNSTSGVISFTSDYDSNGTYMVNISVSDGVDVDYKIFSLTIVDVNRKPAAVISSPSNNAKFTTKDVIVFDATGSSDPDNDNLTYSWVSNIDGNIGSTAVFSSKLSSGTHTITLTINDRHSGTDTKQITITVNKLVSEHKPSLIPMLDTWMILGVIGLLFGLLCWYKKRK